VTDELNLACFSAFEGAVFEVYMSVFACKTRL